MIKMYRRVFLIKGDTVADSARSGLYCIHSVTAQVRQMNERWIVSFSHLFQNFLGEESTFLNGKDWIFSTKISSIFLFMCAGTFFLNEQKEVERTLCCSFLCKSEFPVASIHWPLSWKSKFQNVATYIHQN